jgi:cell division protein FtsI/penicillin-binding protein 2
VLAASAPRQTDPVRTTIAPSVVRAAVAGLAGRLGGVTVMDPRTGEILGFAGIAFSGLQPPGSTMKIITLAAGLEAGITSRRKRYPVETATSLEGVRLENANGEACGGTLANSFAESCNSVFAPMGAELGARRLVAAAERFGFNGPPAIPGAAPSTLPAAAEIGDDLAVGSSAIGQGRVQATSLQMAVVAATIARGGRRPRPRWTSRRPAAAAAGPPTGRPPLPRHRRTVSDLMTGVVREGHGTAAAIPGVRVAGKTGTAELETTQRCEPVDGNPRPAGPAR